MIQFRGDGRVAPLETGGQVGDAPDEGLVARSNDDAHARAFHGECATES